MKLRIEVEKDAIEEARQLFKDNRELIALLNRLGRVYSDREQRRRWVCHIACTDGEWMRFKDMMTHTRTAFVREYDRGTTLLVVKHILPRTDWTYEVFFWLWSAAKV